MKIPSQYNPRGSCYVGRPKLRWKDQEHLQHQVEHVLIDLNIKIDDNDDEDNLNNFKSCTV
jgi:hypothetical protein